MTSQNNLRGPSDAGTGDYERYVEFWMVKTTGWGRVGKDLEFNQLPIRKYA